MQREKSRSLSSLNQPGPEDKLDRDTLFRMTFNELRPFFIKTLGDLDKQGLTHKTFLYSTYYLLDGWITEHLNKRRMINGILNVNPEAAYHTWLNRLTKEAAQLEKAVYEAKESNSFTPFSSTFNTQGLKTIDDLEIALAGINNLIEKLREPFKSPQRVNRAASITTRRI
jgi:hypothetical protein